MRHRKSIVALNASQYHRSRKKLKSQIVNELAPILNLKCRYLAFLLRTANRRLVTPSGIHFVTDPSISLIRRRGRKKLYPAELVPPLELLWKLARCVSSVHLVWFIRHNRTALFAHLELKDLSPVLKDKLCTMSAATVDRLLRQVRRNRLLNERYRPNPFASHLKKTIPVETYHDKPKDQLGYLEVDLVSFGGASPGGEFACALNATEITTGWTELRALRNKAQVWTKAALLDISQTLPFKPTALHSDNGSEFINHYLDEFARATLKIPFTRSRPYCKNDSPFVESKNWSLVRTYVGYRRYDSAEELRILDELLRLISIKHNYFMPTMKIKERYWQGRHLIRRYSIDSPLGRLLGQPDQVVPLARKEQLRKVRAGIDLLKLLLRIDELERALDRAYQRKYIHPRSESA